MKQFTSKDQTAKLIELGFPKPKGWGNKDMSNGMSIALYKDSREDFNYSIGELIGFLPQHNVVIKPPDYNGPNYAVYYKIRPSKGASRGELIDALFKACVTLKEEGVI